MTDSEILEQAIQKAKRNGFKTNITSFTKSGIAGKDYYSIIFSHDFAKAFWGGWCDMDTEPSQTMHHWQYHLQQMVLCENPLKYLAKFLENERQCIYDGKHNCDHKTQRGLP